MASASGRAGGDTSMIIWPALPLHAWVFNARITRVIDADSLIAELDGGFHNTQTETLRLWGINAPEVVGASKPAGLAATTFVRAWVQSYADGAVKWPFRMLTVKGDDAFGRYLCLVFAIKDGRCLNQDILDAGHAVEDVR